MAPWVEILGDNARGKFAEIRGHLQSVHSGYEWLAGDGFLHWGFKTCICTNLGYLFFWCNLTDELLFEVAHWISENCWLPRYSIWEGAIR